VIFDSGSALQFLVGAILGITIAFGARALGLLTAGGGRAAATVGALTFGMGGIIPALLMIAFFGSSSALSRFGRALKISVLPKFAKGDSRDQGQVWANGGIPAALAVIYGLTGELPWLIGLAGALAAATADTWATELGVLAKSNPRLITNWRQVDPGTSGAISLQGSGAAALGAAAIAGLAGILTGGVDIIPPILVGGLLGTVADSLLGATIQSLYWCPVCEAETERPALHSCGNQTIYHRGYHWLRNDQVNLAASLAGALIAMGLWIILR
jgi:uncharacterized protein (TIGR00297 family)